MRNKKRIRELLDILEEIWKTNPDLRLGQLIKNQYQEKDFYYEEDDKFLMRLAYSISDDEKRNKITAKLFKIHIFEKRKKNEQ